ncbi:MAG: MFS transporter [Rhodospirillales bacterium]|nr:MFS transporter [Rhodospirillales bacterium]
MASATSRHVVSSAAAVVVLMSSIGTLYSWSIFVAPIEAEFGHSRSVTSVVFAVATTAFTVAMLTGDSITRGRSLRSNALFACLLGAGGLALSAAADSIWLVLLGFGALFGFSNGFVYGVSLQVAQQTTAAQRGLLTGIAVSSYMLGSAVGTPLLSASVTLWNYRATMLILAGYLAVSGVLAYLLLRWSRIGSSSSGPMPDTGESGPNAGDIAILWTAFLLSSVVGVMTLAHAAPLAASLDGVGQDLAFAVVLSALGNGIGRLAGGWLCDRLPARALLCGAPALSGIALAAVTAIPTIDLLLTSLFVVGLGYGCIAGCLPAIVARAYGVRRLASIYGRLFTAWGVAGLVAPYLGGLSFDRDGSYSTAIAAAALAAMVASILGAAYKPALVPGISQTRK